MPQHAVARRTVDVQPPRLMTSANPVLFAFLGVSCHAFSHSSLMPPPPPSFLLALGAVALSFRTSPRHHMFTLSAVLRPLFYPPRTPIHLSLPARIH